MVEETGCGPLALRLNGRALGVLTMVLALAAGYAMHLAGWLEPLVGRFLRIPERPQDALAGVVDVFTCCIFTWEVIPIVLPAFLLGGAVAAFVPTGVILRYLGAGAKQPRAYAVAAMSGMVLSMCSCNIVPLFVSIYRRGAGIGPAFALLYAGPAINIVAIFFTIQVIDVTTGFWRILSVAVISVVVGVAMSLLFRREARERAQEADEAPPLTAAASAAGWHVWALFFGLLVIAAFGAWVKDWNWRGAGYAVLIPPLIVLLCRKFDGDDMREWAGETWSLVKLVIPILVPVLLVIGAVASFLDIKLVHAWIGDAPPDSGWFREMRPVLVADLLGAIMYFPMLSEVAFAKAFLKDGTMSLGPALAVLLSGPGVSFPGLIIISKAVGVKKAVAYQFLVIALTFAFAALYGSEVGRYICACMLGH